MAEFPTAVSPPGGASYSAPLLNFSNFANWSADDPYKLATEKAKLEQIQQQVELSKAFAGGIPKKDGVNDYGAAAGILFSKGDIAGGLEVLRMQQAPLPPILGGGQPQQGGPPQGQPGPQAAPQGQPSSVQARPLPPPGRGPQGDAGTGTVTSMVTDRLPAQNQTTGETIMRIAQVMGVDPNADLTPGQQKRAEGLLKKYAPEIAGTSVKGGGAQTADGSPSFKDRFGGDAGGSLPPSANAGTPSPKVTQQPAQAAGAPAQGASVAPGAAAPQAAPAQPQQPLVPQEPLPRGYTDPMKAIADLRAAANQAAADPRPNAKVYAQRADAWADRIEAGLKPIEMSPGKVLLDPRTGQPVYQGNQPTLSPQATQDAAERYLQTGQFPPNMGRGMQGTGDRNAILEEANRLATERGINTAELPQRWQQFKAQQVAIQRFTSGPRGDTIRSFNVLVDHLDTLREAGDALKNGDVRRFNKWKQMWATETGEPAPTSFDGVKALVGDEIVKAVVGSAGALADREEVKKDLDKASSPKQLADLIGKYDKLALGQLKGLRKQYEVSTGLKNFGELLLPGTLAALGGGKGEDSKPATATEQKASSTFQNTTPDGFGWSIEK